METLLSPPKYLVGLALNPAAPGNEAKLFSTSFPNNVGSIPVPKTETPDLVKAEVANS